MDALFVKKQIEMIFEDFDVAAIKIGMLFNTEIIDTVYEIIKELDIPIVLDPVSISKAGSPLLQESAVNAMKKLFDHVTVITPNAYEAYEFFGYQQGDRASYKAIQSTNTPVLVKHHVVELAEGKFSIDKLYSHNKERIFQTGFIQTSNLHGTGCSFSSAITANLALGHTLEHSISIAKKFISDALKSAPQIGHGPGPINHKIGGEYVEYA
jgi:hydroxymethylpyrimidine/phosphomethylpyrimidine kinase